ncbi:sterol transport protein [Malassezia pachydermatis]
MKVAWAISFVALLCAIVTAVPCGEHGQVVFRPALDEDEPMDLVAILEQEATAQGLELDVPSAAPHPKIAQIGWHMEDCSPIPPVITIQSVTLDPDPPMKGHNLTEGTYLDVDVHIGVLKLYSERLDFCDVLRENDVEVQCPIPPGDYDVSHTVLVPARLPPAKFSIHVTGGTQDNQPLPCVNIGVSVSPFVSQMASYLRAVPQWLAAKWPRRS